MNPEISSATEKAPKINFPPKPALISTLSPHSDSPALSEEISLPPPPPEIISQKNSSELSKKATSFSPGLLLLLLAFGVALLAFVVQLWLFF